ncbi:hypothetical protein ACQEU8_10710 [Streptomyces sp. CA-250714]|uniref:hypothetical protein n=1 Tax=Streptomyces sp. CA-250714 TaxID=3240060 RepID=UPI003D9295C8
MDRTAPPDTAALAAEVEDLMSAPEPDGVFRDSRECAGAALLLALLLASPPTPRPKTDTK